MRCFRSARLLRRSGLAPSAIRFYEDEGLVHPARRDGGQRRYRPRGAPTARLHPGRPAPRLEPGRDRRRPRITPGRSNANGQGLGSAVASVAPAPGRTDRQPGGAARPTVVMHRLWLPLIAGMRARTTQRTEPPPSAPVPATYSATRQTRSPAVPRPSPGPGGRTTKPHGDGPSTHCIVLATTWTGRYAPIRGCHLP